MNIMKKYWDTVCLSQLTITPFACLCAGIYYTFYWSRGFFEHALLPWLVAFDCSQIIYLVIGILLIYENKRERIAFAAYLRIVKLFLTVSLLIQYSFIVFLFPNSYTWGCTFLFLALLMFSFDFKMMLFNVIAYFVLSAISHICYAEANLPSGGTQYYDDIIFRVIIYVLFSVLSCSITYFAEKFILQIQNDDDQKDYIFERQLSYYENLGLMDRELRKFRHDIANHFLCMQELIKRKDTRGLEEYFANLSTDYSAKPQLYFSGNIIIDSILNHDITHLCLPHVTPVVYGRLPEIKTVSSMDLCTVFSNMLSNAIKGANRLTTASELTVQFQEGKRYFSICVTNQTEQLSPVVPSAQNMNELSEKNIAESSEKNISESSKNIDESSEKLSEALSKKPETHGSRRGRKPPQNTANPAMDRNHGYGILNIERVVEKYSGIFEQEFDPPTNSFTMKVYLPI